MQKAWCGEIIGWRLRAATKGGHEGNLVLVGVCVAHRFCLPLFNSLFPLSSLFSLLSLSFFLFFFSFLLSPPLFAFFFFLIHSSTCNQVVVQSTGREKRHLEESEPAQLRVGGIKNERILQCGLSIYMHMHMYISSYPNPNPLLLPVRFCGRSGCVFLWQHHISTRLSYYLPHLSSSFYYPSHIL